MKMDEQGKETHSNHDGNKVDHFESEMGGWDRVIIMGLLGETIYP